MNKRILLSGIVATFVAGLTSPIFADDISDLKSEVAKLNAKIVEMEKKQSNISLLEDRLETVETSSLTDKIDLGFTFRTRYDSVNYDKGTDDKLWTTKLNLNLKSKVNDDVKFSGRLTSYKNWGNNYNSSYSNYDSKQGRIANSSGLFMERAYVDWTAVKGDIPIIFTVGRQPSSDGPSWQFAENSVRKGTYDALLFDGASDGIVMTVPLNKVVNNEALAFRLGYGKGVESESYKNATGGEIKDNTVIGAFLEGSCLLFPQGTWALSYSKATNIVGDDNTGATASKNLGNMSWYGLALEIPEIIKGLDVFAHYAHNKSTKNSNTINMDLNGDGDSNDAAFGETSVSLLDGSGSAIWLGARYNLAGFAKVGLEYNKGSKNWFSMTNGSLDPLNKLATRGNVVDAYIIKDIAKATHVKVGYMQMKYDYTGSGYHVTQPMDITAAGKNDKTKNMYAEFVVNF